MAHDTSVSLNEHFAEFVDEQVESGRYTTASDVVHQALRMLEGYETKLARLRALLAEFEEDIKAGRVYEMNDAFWEELGREVDERIKRGEKPAAHVLP